MSNIDLDQLNEALIARLSSLLPEVCPGGKFAGNEYKAGSIRGGSGDSFSMNTKTGAWADFAVHEHRGNTALSYFITLDGLSTMQTAKIWAQKIGFSGNGGKMAKRAPAKCGDESTHVAPPADAGVPSMNLPNLGSPTMSWVYRSTSGKPMFYVARYDLEDGGKEFRPWTWSPAAQDWAVKAWKKPRPLYGLDDLERKKGRKVLLTEGEKACDAARLIVGENMACLTWQGGSNAVEQTDFSPLFGKKVILWPDADEPGVKAMDRIADLLLPNCPEVKVIDPFGNCETPPKGFDAADFEGDYDKFFSWAKARIKIIGPAPAPLIVNAQGAEAIQINQTVIAPDDSGPIPASIEALCQSCNCAMQKNGLPVCNEDNVCRVMEHWEGFHKKIWFDEFHVKIFTDWAGPVREWTNADMVKLLVFMQREFGFQKIAKSNIKAALSHFAFQDIRNEPRGWLESLEWDNVPRIDGFFANFMGAPDEVYIHQASSNFFIGTVARIFQPGCQVDNMIVLEGKQGTLKTSSLRALAGDWYGSTKESFASKDFYLALQSKMIVEIAELGTLLKTTSWEVVRDGISCREDRFRPPYGDVVQSYPRSCVMVGTTNQDDYLGDLTGNRRFWPIPTGKIDLKGILENRKAFFAEAVSRFKAGEAWWAMPEDATLAMQDSRLQVDEWQGPIIEYLIGKDDVLCREILKDVFKYGVGEDKMADQRRVANILRRIGWEKCSVRESFGVVKRWRRVMPRNESFDLTLTP